MRFDSSLVTNVQRINNKDAHRSNDSGASRLGNDCTRKLGMAPPKRAVVTTDEYEGSIPSLVTKINKL